MQVVTRKASLLLAAIILLLCCLSASAQETPDYAAYFAMHQQAAQPDAVIEIDLSSHPFAQPGLQSGAAAPPAVLEQSAGEAPLSFEFETKQAGLYQLEVDYLALPARRGVIEANIALDGAVPFSQAEGLLFRRLFETQGSIRRDSRGNDVRPSMREAALWQSQRPQDYRNHFSDPYFFYLSEGSHTFSIALTAEKWALGGLRFVPAATVPSYEDYASVFPREDTGVTFTQQAEEAGLRNSEVIYALAARGDAAITPNDPVKTRLNTIGGYSWKQQGEWVEWQAEAPADGWYALEIHALNDFVRGMPANRRLYVDGKLPFEEARSLSFPYQNGWQFWTMRDTEGNLMPLYLTQGQHSIRLEVSSGRNAESLRRLEGVISQMNRLYREIIVITGDNADSSRVTVDLNWCCLMKTAIQCFTRPCPPSVPSCCT